MIPKTIHYCWFGRGEKPDSVKKYIKTWKKYCPDYALKEWNEDNFDVNSNQYVKEAYENKKWAFVTDYVRLFALYNEGGIYMDTDVEVLKPLDKFLKNQAFSSFEDSDTIPTGIMGSEKGNKWIKDLLAEYDELRFVKPDGELDLTTNVTRITELTKKKYGLICKSSFQKLGNGCVTIYPYDYFCPKSWRTGKIKVTKNSHTIHHFSGTWLDEQGQFRLRISKKLKNIFPQRVADVIAACILNIRYPGRMLKRFKGKALKK